MGREARSKANKNQAPTEGGTELLTVIDAALTQALSAMEACLIMAQRQQLGERLDPSDLEIIVTQSRATIAALTTQRDRLRDAMRRME